MFITGEGKWLRHSVLNIECNQEIIEINSTYAHNNAQKSENSLGKLEKCLYIFLFIHHINTINVREVKG